MSRVNFRLNRAGVRELMRSPEAMSVVREEAVKTQQIALQSCPGYEMDTHTGTNRVNAMVYADTYEARKDNYEHNTLLKALGGGSR